MKDKEIEALINKELERQRHTIELIASENIVSEDVLEAAGSILTNKYAEGACAKRLQFKYLTTKEKAKYLQTDTTPETEYTLPAKRYYNGCGVIDKIEFLGCERFRKLFNTDYHVNLQPHSGANANMAVFLAVLNPGDTVLSMDLSNGGHLSHGSPVNFSGKYYNIVSYGVNDNGEIDYEEVARLAQEHKPRLIICGASNYSKIIDFEKFGEIAKSVNAYLLADIAHIAGLIAGGQHPSPFGIADFVTTTTHKSLRGPRGGVTSCKQEYAALIDKTIFPGMQGGPLEHIIAAKAVCFGEALKPEFKEYGEQIVKNAKTLSSELIRLGVPIVGGVTENHVMTVDLRELGITGKDAANILEEVGITCNKNTVPNDPQSPFVTSGLRLGTPAVTSRGMKEEDMKTIAAIIANVVKAPRDEEIKATAKQTAEHLLKQFPLYENKQYNK